MNIDDLIRIALHHDLRNYDKETCQNNQIQLILLQFIQKGLIELVSRRIALRGDT